MTGQGTLVKGCGVLFHAWRRTQPFTLYCGGWVHLLTDDPAEAEARHKEMHDSTRPMSDRRKRARKIRP